MKKKKYWREKSDGWDLPKEEYTDNDNILDVEQEEKGNQLSRREIGLHNSWRKTEDVTYKLHLREEA